jgi:hypothetical protein
VLAGASEAVRARVAALEGRLGAGAAAIPTLIPGSGELTGAALPPARIGVFRLTELLGRGGMGEVWAGSRDDGLFEQTVAIKLIQRHALARAAAVFDDERRFLARLEHPHICRLIDGGMTDEGLPWLAMEYCDGRPIDEAVAGRPLATRVATFAKAAEAVQYAHGRMVAHADLKPTNIMVARDGTPKLLDFGIARLIDDPTRGTAPPSRAGGALTREFASPQRLAGAGASVADDIFALGRTLSILIGDDTDRELAAIAARASHADEARRYGSVAALIADLDRWRARLPVEALPPTLAYRAGKFVERHRWGVGATGMALAMLSATSLLATSSYLRAEHTRLRAEQRFDDVRDLSRFMLFDLYDELARMPGTVAKRAEIAATSARYLDRLSITGESGTDLRLDTARSYRRLAEIEGVPAPSNLGQPEAAGRSLDHAHRLLTDLLAQQPRNVAALSELGWVELDRWALLADNPAAAATRAAGRLAFRRALRLDAGDASARLGLIAAARAEAYELVWSRDLPARAMPVARHALAALRAHPWPAGLRARGVDGSQPARPDRRRDLLCGGRGRRAAAVPAIRGTDRAPDRDRRRDPRTADRAGGRRVQHQRHAGGSCRSRGGGAGDGAGGHRQSAPAVGRRSRRRRREAPAHPLRPGGDGAGEDGADRRGAGAAPSGNRVARGAPGRRAARPAARPRPRHRSDPAGTGDGSRRAPRGGVRDRDAQHGAVATHRRGRQPQHARRRPGSVQDRDTAKKPLLRFIRLARFRRPLRLLPCHHPWEGRMKIGYLVSGTALVIAAGAAGSGVAAAQSAPPTYNSCVGPANGNIVAVNPRSCVATSVSGYPGAGGHITGARAAIINGREDADNTGASGGATASTAWSDDGWTNAAVTTSNAGAIARGTASLADGTVKAFGTNPDANWGQGSVLATISDIVTFNNTTGSAIDFRVGYTFDGAYANGQNNNFDSTSVYLALTSPTYANAITFANSGLGLGGYGLSRGWADGFFDQQWFFAGQAQDFTITSFGTPTGGPFGGGISTLLSIPTGVSQLGFTLSLDMSCRVPGSTCDFGDTSAFRFGALPDGLSYTSSSGTLFSALTPPTSGVPEPATWAMLVVGFGLMGAAMRRRPAAHRLAV